MRGCCDARKADESCHPAISRPVSGQPQKRSKERTRKAELSGKMGRIAKSDGPSLGETKVDTRRFSEFFSTDSINERGTAGFLPRPRDRPKPSRQNVLRPEIGFFWKSHCFRGGVAQFRPKDIRALTSRFSRVVLPAPASRPARSKSARDRSPSPTRGPPDPRRPRRAAWPAAG